MRQPREITDRMRAKKETPSGGFVRARFTLPRDAARVKAREILERYPVGGYATTVESWLQLTDGRIEFTMRRLPTAD